MKKISELLRFWLSGIRVYIALATILLTLAVWWWGRTVFGGTQLEAIRIQEAYGWLSVLCLALVLMIGPLTKLVPHLPGKEIVFDSRRALGLSAAWFSLLHALIVYFKQFQGSNPLQLPTTYQQAMLLGVIALLILGAMAATSVNAIIKHWGIWWFRLHRLIYFAVVVILVHTFMIGAHATQTGALVTLGIIALIWIIANILILARSPEVKPLKVATICLAILVIAITMAYGIRQQHEATRTAAAAEHTHR